MSGCLGKSDIFHHAIGKSAIAPADQQEQDHTAPVGEDL